MSTVLSYFWSCKQRQNKLQYIINKFPREKYFTGKIFRGLNFCGSSHSRTSNPLKSNGNGWKWPHMTRYQSAFCVCGYHVSRRYGKLQLVKLLYACSLKTETPWLLKGQGKLLDICHERCCGSASFTLVAPILFDEAHPKYSPCFQHHMRKSTYYER